MRTPSDQLGHELAMNLRAAYSHLRRRSNLAFAPFGISSDQYVVLAVLEEVGEATQQELVLRCFSDTATVGAMLTLMESKGLVVRNPHPEDGRARTVKLTESGLRLTQEMTHESSSLRREVTNLYSPAEVQTLMELLDRLAKALPPQGRKSLSQKPRPSGRPAPRTLPVT
ncbi:MAG TPA: MarR family winged helix-turn-helix transcriptional regulator [Candidatus Limnocylindria bacterium]|nr:MarR family winged helix-turn-helix transcriptional regulator [Candidatus Limnocylindria bacterium]